MHQYFDNPRYLGYNLLEIGAQFKGGISLASNQPANRKKRPPLTKKQIMVQMLLCVSILAYFAIQENFFGKTKPTPTQTPTVSAQNVLEATGQENLTTEAIGAMKDSLPNLSGDWKVLIVDNGASFVLVSPGQTGTNEELLAAGYEIGQQVRAHVADLPALSALLYKIPTGGSVEVGNADGSLVSSTLYAQVADGVRKAGLSVKLASEK